MRNLIKKLSLTKFVAFNAALFFHLSSFSYCMSNDQIKKWQPECARYEALVRSIENTCATAGNIDRCIQLKMQGYNGHGNAPICQILDVSVAFWDLDKINKKPLGSSCREAKSPQ
jgi:hypothetical protein